jgi:hypothetical protein
MSRAPGCSCPAALSFLTGFAELPATDAPIIARFSDGPLGLYSGLTMETIRITTDTSKHAGCGGILAMSQEAPQYIIQHEGLETLIGGVEMVCLKCGERIRSQAQVEIVEE